MLSLTFVCILVVRRLSGPPFSSVSLINSVSSAEWAFGTVVRLLIEPTVVIYMCYCSKNGLAGRPKKKHITKGV